MGNRIRGKKEAAIFGFKITDFHNFQKYRSKGYYKNNKDSINYKMFCLKRSLEAAS